MSFGQKIKVAKFEIKVLLTLSGGSNERYYEGFYLFIELQKKRQRETGRGTEREGTGGERGGRRE